ncbi:MAG: hypothetical protein MZV70_08765 [Desulfobacterales bacterium]|nr:hypothetical protein [Desulfobacterales bacterium]
MFLARWVGISQKKCLKLGHAIRAMMAPDSRLLPALSGIVEPDEKYIGKCSRFSENGIVHKRGKGTKKYRSAGTAERGGPVRAVPATRDDSIASLSPVITRLVDKPRI